MNAAQLMRMVIRRQKGRAQLVFHNGQLITKCIDCNDLIYSVKGKFCLSCYARECSHL